MASSSAYAGQSGPSAGLPRRHVLPEGQLEPDEVLEHGGDPAPPRFQVEVPQVGAVDLDGARLRVVQPAQQLGEGGLARPVLADDGERAARGDLQAEPAQHGPVRAGRVGEGHVAERDLAGGHARRPGGCPTRSRRPAHRARSLLGAGQPGDRRDRRGGAVEGPVQPAERDHRRARGRRGVGDRGSRGRAGRRARPTRASRTRATLAARTSARLSRTERSRIRVASYCSRCSRRRLTRNRSSTQSGSPKIRSSLAAGGSTASR